MSDSTLSHSQSPNPRLYRLARGVDDEEVKPRTLPKSISCGKTFRGASALRDLATTRTWLLQVGDPPHAREQLPIACKTSANCPCSWPARWRTA